MSTRNTTRSAWRAHCMSLPLRDTIERSWTLMHGLCCCLLECVLATAQQSPLSPIALVNELRAPTPPAFWWQHAHWLMRSPGKATTSMLTSDFSSANVAGFQTITGLTWTTLANTAQNMPFERQLRYSQATHVSNLIVAPTRIDAGWLNTAAGGSDFSQFDGPNLRYRNGDCDRQSKCVHRAPRDLSERHSGARADASTSAINIMALHARPADVGVSTWEVAEYGESICTPDKRESRPGA
jgi:hypothetical protein